MMLTFNLMRAVTIFRKAIDLNKIELPLDDKLTEKGVKPSAVGRVTVKTQRDADA